MSEESLNTRQDQSGIVATAVTTGRPAVEGCSVAEKSVRPQTATASADPLYDLEMLARARKKKAEREVVREAAKRARAARLAGGGSRDEPADGTAVGDAAGEAAGTAVTQKLGRPQTDQQAHTPSGVKRIPRAEKRERSSREWREFQEREWQKERESQRVFVDGVQVQGQAFRVAVAEQARQVRLGRPSEYTEEQGQAICDWVRNGKSLRSYCQQASMGMETVYRWMRAHPSFRDQYERAQEDRADTLADELLAVVDDIPQDASLEQVQIAKLRMDARKWIASKLRPGRWGDKQVVEHTGGGISINIGIPQKPKLDAVEDVTAVEKGRLPGS